MTLFRTAVQTAISEVHKLLRTGGVPTAFKNIIFFFFFSGGPRPLSLCGSGRADEPLTILPAPPTPHPRPHPTFPPSLISRIASVDVKQHVYLLTTAFPTTHRFISSFLFFLFLFVVFVVVFLMYVLCLFLCLHFEFELFDVQSCWFALRLTNEERIQVGS